MELKLAEDTTRQLSGARGLCAPLPTTRVLNRGPCARTPKLLFALRFGVHSSFSCSTNCRACLIRCLSRCHAYLYVTSEDIFFKVVSLGMDVFELEHAPPQPFAQTLFSFHGHSRLPDSFNTQLHLRIHPYRLLHHQCHFGGS